MATYTDDNLYLIGEDLMSRTVVGETDLISTTIGSSTVDGYWDPETLNRYYQMTKELVKHAEPNGRLVLMEE